MSNKKNWLIVGLIGLLVVVGLIILTVDKKGEETPAENTVPEEVIEDISTTTHRVIGSSVEMRDIETFTFGTGDTDLLFVGGVHGGYEWNSILLAYEMIDYFKENDVIPNNITVHIIPNLNPDGLFLATGLTGEFLATDIISNEMHESGTGRFNARDVDLNRNFDCKWAPESSWRGKVVKAGTKAFSEPEAVALRDYVHEINPKAVIFWHSMANNVYASECTNGVLPETLSLMNSYANATKYGAVPSFDAYPVTGDAEGWLASIGIPAITVELGSRTSIEWTDNLAGVTAVLEMYRE